MTVAGPVLVRRGARLADVDLDRHELDALVVPYDVTRRVVDPTDAGTLEEYLEEFAPGSFARQIDDPSTHRGVALRNLHEGGAHAGYGLELADDAAGVRARFRILPGAYDDVATMIDDGVDGVSVGFVAVRSRAVRRPAGEVRRRLVAFLDHVALEPIPAYDTARVLSLRGGVVDVDADRPTPARDELAAYLSSRLTHQENNPS